MTTLLIPMAGAGSRFADAGYKTSKPLIPTTDRRTGQKIPMIVAATLDMPNAHDKNTRIIYIDRDFHRDSGVHDEIKAYFPQAEFLTIDYLTAGQAATCMLAKDMLDPEDDLFIGACDNGLAYDQEAFASACINSDALVISHTNDSNISRNPNAHSWLHILPDGQTVSGMAIKKTVSDAPMNDHATTGMFWFKKAKYFTDATTTMMNANDKSGGEFYVDNVVQYVIQNNQKVGFLDVTYLCWGTPKDYEDYEATLDYWKNFQIAESNKS